MRKKIAFITILVAIAFATVAANETQEVSSFFSTKEQNGGWCIGPKGACQIPPN